jgi:2-hydroxychromene-2-carboxylate isomerase
MTAAPAPPAKAAAAPGGPIDFWFDFISPYGYFASQRIDALAARHGREVRWHPLLLGVTVLKVMKLPPVMQTPLKADYVRREVARYKRRHGVVLARDLSAPPMNPLPAARAFAWLLEAAPAHAKPFAREVFRRTWGEGRDVVEAESLLDAGRAAGVPEALLHTATQGPEPAERLRAEVDAAIACGAFGSPFFLVDGEPFFGVDKLELIERWLAEGGW